MKIGSFKKYLDSKKRGSLVGQREKQTSHSNMVVNVSTIRLLFVGTIVSKDGQQIYRHEGDQETESSAANSHVKSTTRATFSGISAALLGLRPT